MYQFVSSSFVPYCTHRLGGIPISVGEDTKRMEKNPKRSDCKGSLHEGNQVGLTLEQIQAEKKGQSPSGCEVGVEGKKPDCLLTWAMAISTTESSHSSPA